jgi:hypothetical protein
MRTGKKHSDLWGPGRDIKDIIGTRSPRTDEHRYICPALPLAQFPFTVKCRLNSKLVIARQYRERMASPHNLEKRDSHLPRSASPSSSSTLSTSSDSEDSVSHLSIVRQRTLPNPGYDANDETVLDRQRTATSIYEQTVGGDYFHKQRTPSVFSRITSRTSSEEWPEFGGGKGRPCSPTIMLEFSLTDR